MNIVFVHSGKWEYPTGIITHIHNLARALGDKGHSVKVVMQGKEKEFIEGNVVYLFSPNLFQFILDVPRRVRKAEIIHCHDTLSVLASLPKGKRALIYTNHSVFADTEFHRSYQEWQGKVSLSLRTRLKCSITKILGRNVLKNVDRVIAVSNFVKDKIKQIYGVADSKIEVVFNGIEAKDFTSGKITFSEDNSNRILFIKPNESRKGFHHLLKALPLVLERMPKAKLIAVGLEPSGNYKNYIKNLLDKHHISDKVIFTGKITFGELVPLYLSSHVVVIPSVYEAFTIVALEAGICGKPVVASNAAGLNEVVVDGETGFLVDVKDPDLLAETLIKVLSNNSLQRQLGENAKTRVLENFTWDRISAKVEGIYEAALAESLLGAE